MVCFYKKRNLTTIGFFFFKLLYNKEPNLPPLILRSNYSLPSNTMDASETKDTTTTSSINSSVEKIISKHLPKELPHEAYQRILTQYKNNISTQNAKLLTSSTKLLNLFEDSISEAMEKSNNEYSLKQSDDKKVLLLQKISSSVSNLICNDYFSTVNYHNNSSKEGEEGGTSTNNEIEDDQINISPKQIGHLAIMIEYELISKHTAKKILRILYEENNNNNNTEKKDDDESKSNGPTEFKLPESIAEEYNLFLISDPDEIKQILEATLSSSINDNDYKKDTKSSSIIQKTLSEYSTLFLHQSQQQNNKKNNQDGSSSSKKSNKKVDKKLQKLESFLSGQIMRVHENLHPQKMKVVLHEVLMEKMQYESKEERDN